MSSPSSGSSPQPPEVVPAHAPLTGYYESDATRSRYVVDLFDRTARHYNTIERLLLNGGLWYRWYCLRRAGLSRGMKVLDVAIGTAAVARGAVRLVGPEGSVVGVDPSRGMLGEARKVFHGPLARGRAEALPFASDRFDFVTMGIALRHVADLRATFAEYLRVLRPGGTLWILEGYAPASPLARRATRLMMGRMVPAMTRLFTGSRDAQVLMDFYWDTVEQSARPETIQGTMADVGFTALEHRVVAPVCEYIGRKPAA